MHGGLPKELPHMFSYAHLSAIVRRRGFSEALSAAVRANGVQSECCTFSFPKGDANRRHLSLPNPAFHIDLMKEILKNWKAIRQQIVKNSISASAPRFRGDFRTSGRFLEPTTRRSRLFLEHIGHAAEFKVLLEFDISHFYPSIYTHSLEWAMVGRDSAKAARANRPVSPTTKVLLKIGQVLDEKARRMRSSETIGLPVGPDSSFLLAELVASRLDIEIAGRLSAFNNQSGIVGYRYYDDYSLYFTEEDEARKALDVIADVFSTFHLRLNENKTRVSRLPIAFRQDWTDYFGDYYFAPDANGKADIRKLNLYFSEAFRIQGDRSTEGVLNYALSRFTPRSALGHSGSIETEGIVEEVKIPSNYRITFIALMCQVLISRPDTAGRVFAILRRQSLIDATEKEGRQILEKSLQMMIRGAGPHRHHELLWALTFAVYFGLSIEPSWSVIEQCSNPLVVLLALDYKMHRKRSYKVPTEWSALVQSPTDLYSANWLLAYEAVRRGWLKTPKDHIGDNAFFTFLNKRNVAIYLDRGTSKVKYEDIVDEGLGRMSFGASWPYGPRAL